MEQFVYSFALLFALIVGHYLADYPLQGDFLSKAKNSRQPIDGVPWRHCLIAHSVIHAGMVAAIVGAWGVLTPWIGNPPVAIFFGMITGIVEGLDHYSVDHQKCTGEIDFHQDQVEHLTMKMFIWSGVVIFAFVFSVTS